MQVHFWSVEELVILPLILHILSDDVLIDAYGVHKISARPETLLGDRSFPCEDIVSADGALPFEETHDVGHGMFGRYFENEVDMIGTGIAFEDVHFLLLSEFSEDFANLDSDGSIENFLAVLWYNDHVVFAVPYHMAL